MGEVLFEETSSVGAFWPPEASSYGRMRGFYNKVLHAEGVESFATNFDKLRTEVANSDDLSRLTIRALGTKATVQALEQRGVGVEGALPIRGSDLSVIYTAWNASTRQPGDERMAEHAELLDKTVGALDAQSSVAQAHPPGKFEPKIIDSSLSEYSKLQLAPGFIELYSVFGYDEEEVRALLINPSNTILYFEGDDGIVSTAMAEHATIEVEEFGSLNMVEVTEATTRPGDRGNGYYRAISRQLVQHLMNETDRPIDILYGESNLTMPGVIISAHKNGRQFSFFDRDKFGSRNPFFGVLQQNFKVEDGTEKRQFNDFALSYVPLG